MHSLGGVGLLPQLFCFPSSAQLLERGRLGTLQSPHVLTHAPFSRVEHRLVSLDGLVLRRRLNPRDLILDEEVVAFHGNVVGIDE